MQPGQFCSERARNIMKAYREKSHFDWTYQNSCLHWGFGQLIWLQPSFFSIGALHCSRVEIDLERAEAQCAREPSLAYLGTRTRIGSHP